MATKPVNLYVFTYNDRYRQVPKLFRNLPVSVIVCEYMSDFKHSTTRQFAPDEISQMNTILVVRPMTDLVWAGQQSVFKKINLYTPILAF